MGRVVCLYLLHSLIRGWQPDLRDTHPLQIGYFALEELPPAQLGVFAIPSEELNLLVE